MTAATDWVTSKATYDAAIVTEATSAAAIVTAAADLSTKRDVLTALVTDNDPLKVYNTSGTTYVTVLRVGGSTFVTKVTM